METRPLLAGLALYEWAASVNPFDKAASVRKGYTHAQYTAGHDYILQHNGESIPCSLTKNRR